MKPRTKKILITAGTILLLSPISYIAFNRDYHFAKSFGLTKQTQKIFWNLIGDNDYFKKAGGLHFSRQGGGFHDGFPVRKSFILVLDDQWTASYRYNQSPDDLDITVWLLNKENPDKDFAFNVSRTDLKVIKDDKKYRANESISPKQRQQIDAQTTPDSITDTDKLEKLALKKFVEFQNQYFKAN